MSATQMERLVENVKVDGRLTSTVLAYEGPEVDGLEILSGHHRVDAALAAGFETINVEVITTPCDEQRKSAIQLSHNAVVGQDNDSVLLEMYAALDLSAKKYSGLDDDRFTGLEEADIEALGIGSLRYQELIFNFLAEEEEEFVKALDRISAKAKQPRIMLAAYKDFDRFFEAIVAVKRQMNVYNSAIVLRTMADLALERLEEMADGENGTV